MTRRAALAAAALLWTAPALAGPFAEVWPWQARRVGEGVIEYTYDLSPVRSANATDARATHGDQAVTSFLKALPREAKVRVKAPAGYSVSAARGLERLPLTATFSATSEDGYASVDPLGRKLKSRVRAALDPDEPRVLVGAELVLWRVLRLLDGTLAAAELDTDRLRLQLLAGLSDRLQQRLKDVQGDAREGTVVLLARLAVAQACLDPTRLKAKDAEVMTEAAAQLQALNADPTVTTPLGFFTWSPELSCAFRRAQVLGQPFSPSRSGYAAPLTLLLALEGDPKLKATFDKLKQRRDLLLGVPAEEPLASWREKTGAEVGKALDDLGPFIDSLGPRPPPPPPLVSLPSTPFGRFFAGLQGAERLAAVDELWAAAQDGRLQLPARADAPVAALRESALAALAPTDEQKTLSFDTGWRDRFNAAFCALQGASHEARDTGWEPVTSEFEHTELQVKLKLPPVLELEPAPQVYERAADALDRLQTVLFKEGLSSLRPLQPDGPAGAEAAGGELKRWESITRGLARLASVEDAGRAETPQTQAARRFLALWRADPALARDVRLQQPGPVAFGAERAHAVTLGVGRRELSVAFLEAPAAEVVGSPAAVVVERSEQRYLLPVLVTASVRAPANASPRSPSQVRKLIDGAGRESSAAEGALQEGAGP